MTQSLRYTKTFLSVNIFQELTSYLPGVSQRLVLKTFRRCRVWGNSGLLNSLLSYQLESYHEEKGILDSGKGVLTARATRCRAEKLSQLTVSETPQASA